MIKKEISDLKQTLDYLSEEENKVSNIITSLLLCLKNNNKILICGNGGSAAEAEHLSAIGKCGCFVPRRQYPLKGSALSLIPTLPRSTAKARQMVAVRFFIREVWQKAGMEKIPL